MVETTALVFVHGDPRLPARLWRHVEPQESGCWHWTAQLDKNGYGKVRPVDPWTTTRAHRLMYQALVGPIPVGLVPDHECHTRSLAWCPGGPTCIHRRCVFPGDLSLVTQLVNVRRGHNGPRDDCNYGHPLAGSNLVIYKGRGGKPERGCKACRRERSRHSMSWARDVDPGPFLPRLDCEPRKRPTLRSLKVATGGTCE